jgi:hypothetical protein
VYPLIVKYRYMKWRVIVFNATFNNISVMSWRRILWRKLEYPDVVIYSVKKRSMPPHLIIMDKVVLLGAIFKK